MPFKFNCVTDINKINDLHYIMLWFNCISIYKFNWCASCPTFRYISGRYTVEFEIGINIYHYGFVDLFINLNIPGFD